MIAGGRHLKKLREEAPWPSDAEIGDGCTPAEIPLVSVIIPARNEQRNIAAALRSVLAQDYPNLEFMLINDRSTDHTGEIMRQIAAHEARLRVLDVSELPAGWLGKNHALWLGAARADGELLLFADADVIMEPTVIRRAVAHLRSRAADNVTISPVMICSSILLRAMLGAFAMFICFYAIPWRARRPRSRAHVGIGAFNLLRREVYESVGTHHAIAMRPDDDMKLGKLVKRAGFRQEFMIGGALLQIEWYASVRELVEGLMKNAYAGLDYSLLQLAGSVLGMAVGMIWPFMALFLTHGPALWLNAAVVMILAGIYRAIAPQSGIPARYVLFLPLGALLMIYIMLRATWLTHKDNGISWRGTHYPLSQLRANKV